VNGPRFWFRTGKCKTKTEFDLRSNKQAQKSRNLRLWSKTYYANNFVYFCAKKKEKQHNKALYSLFTWSKKWPVWRAGFYIANQSNLKSIQKALIDWKKPALQKSHFCFDHVNRLIKTLNTNSSFLKRYYSSKLPNT